MDNQLYGLQNQQACESALKMKVQIGQQKIVAEEEREGAKRFKTFSIGCILYALFYTWCLYKNQSGITYPFLIGGTLCFFGYYFKRFGVTAAKDKLFLVTAIMFLGIVNCTTDSGVLIFVNGWIEKLLLGVLLLESFHDVLPWRLGTWGKALIHLISGSIAGIFKPIKDAYWFSQFHERTVDNVTRGSKRKILYVILSVITSIPVLIIIMLILCSADELFSDVVGNICETLSELVFRPTVFGILWMVISCFAFVYGLLIYVTKRSYIEQVVSVKNMEFDAVIAIAFLSLITVVYCLFCVLQIVQVCDWFVSPHEGASYAASAREGFFQLLFVSLFNLVLVLGGIGYFKKNKGLQVLLTVISVCTYIIAGSSAIRMLLYIQKYHLTFLRVAVLWTLLMIGIVLAGIIRYIWKKEFGLFRYMLIMVGVGYLIFAGIHPDYWIARYNVFQAKQGEEIDIWYLKDDLSLDAAPVVWDYLKSEEIQGQGVYLIRYENRIEDETENMGIRDWNAGRAYAKALSNKRSR